MTVLCRFSGHCVGSKGLRIDHGYTIRSLGMGTCYAWLARASEAESGIIPPPALDADKR